MCKWENAPDIHYTANTYAHYSGHLAVHRLHSAEHAIVSVNVLYAGSGPSMCAHVSIIGFFVVFFFSAERS